MSRLEAFVQTARQIAKRDTWSPFSLEDVYSLASELDLSGILFLEKSDETRHVNVLLGLDGSRAVLYDPFFGVKVKACDETQLGIYCKPVGSLRDEFQEYEQQAAPAECPDVWSQYLQKGKLLLRFLRHHSKFGDMFSKDGMRSVDSVDLPATQHKLRPADCAPICLFILSLLQPGADHRFIKVRAAGEATKELGMVIQIFVTGGTFDKEYDELRGSLVFKDTHIQEVLRLGRCKQEVDTRTLMMIDSLEMTEVEREIIVENCRKCRWDRIVITHGTDSMETTARVLGQAIKDKTIVLTGAMVPYKFGSSDGLFNLGSALAFVQILPQGVYVAMNGRCFPWDRVKKNKTAGEFEEITSAGEGR